LDQAWLLALAIDIIANATDISYLEMAPQTHSILTPAAQLLRYCYPPKKQVPLNQELKAISQFVAIMEATHNQKFAFVNDYTGDRLKFMVQHGSILTYFVDFFRNTCLNSDLHMDVCFHLLIDQTDVLTLQLEFPISQQIIQSVDRPLTEFA